MKKEVLKYVLFFVLNVVLINVILYKTIFKNVKPATPVPGNIYTLIEKLDHYKKHKKEYNLVFVGDSRTYTNINNYQLDTLLKTNSINMAMWANWFPTQYSFLQDFLPEVPDSTTLIFSVGYQNFMDREISEAYLIDYSRAHEYLDFGFTLYDLRKPLAYNNSKFVPILPLRQLHIHQWFFDILNYEWFAVIEAKHKSVATENAEPIIQSVISSDKNYNASSGTIPKPTAKGPNVDQLESIYKSNPEVIKVLRKLQNDTVTSLEVFWKRGNYWRIELDSMFFRRKQNETAHVPKKGDTIVKTDFVQDERYWKLFEAMIQLLKKKQNKLNIIINFVDEAPYTYWSGRGIFDNFINKKLKPYVLSQGFKFTTVNVLDIPDSDYFDYNHMNNKGTVKYTERLADTLKSNCKSFKKIP